MGRQDMTCNFSKKRAQRLAILAFRLPSPLQCLTSLFGMGRGVSTASSSPDSTEEIDLTMFLEN